VAGVFSNAARSVVGVFARQDEREFLPAALEVVETPASPTVRLSALLIITFFIVAVSWAFLGRVDVEATAEGRVLPAGDVKTIQPLDSGTVRAIDVQDGDHVRRGQLLISLDPTQTGADSDRVFRDLLQARLDVARLSALEAGFRSGGVGRFARPADAPADRVAEAEAAMHAQADQQAAKLSELTQQIAEKAAEEAEVAAQAQKIQATLPILEEKDRINRELVTRGYGTTMAALDAQQALAEARHDLSISDRRAEQARAARAALERQREGAKSTYEADILGDLRKAQEQQTELTAELVKAKDKSAQTEIRSPIDGVVEQLAVHTPHGVVMPAQRLMIVVPDSSDLTVEARLANRDVGFVHAGQTVKVKVETFNFTRYGLLQGRVTDVSRDVVDPQPEAGAPTASSSQAASAAAARQGSPAYVARIALAATSMQVDGQRRPLQPGMAVTAEIRTGDRSIAEYLLSPIARKSQESLHER
jgi:hemolysin D